MPYKNKDKQKAAQKEWYQKNKNLTLERSKSSREKRKKIISDYKESHPCIDCNTYYPHYVMDLDHVSGEKIAKVSDMVRTHSLNKIWEEINKCELVCANCHRERTHKRL